MKTKNFLVKKIIVFQIIFIIVLSIMFNISEVKAYTVTHSQTTRAGIDAFPDSYKSKLQALKAEHPNWNFTAYYTGMSWQEFINGETATHLRNRVHNSSESAWKCSCGQSGGGYACASKGIISYYADPRNFLTDDGIFQFMEMSYNASVQNQSGVQNILANTFMNGSVTISGEREDNSIKAERKGSYIKVSPGTKNSEIGPAIGMNKFKITDSNNRTVSNNDNATTGYNFINTEYNTSYTIIVLGDVNSDGQIKASDYMKIKNYIMKTTTLNNIQKMAADVNGDGEIKASDYMKIKNHIMGTTRISISGKTNSTTTMKYSEIIMKAAEESGISPYSIAIKIIQEVGTKGSGSVSGTYPGYQGYYNFFNWGATDGSNAIEKGLIYAKAQGWNNQYTAIIEGAKKLADSYTSVGQNTAYFYKFDVVDDTSTGLFWHQYMTNVQDPSSQARNLYNTYAKNKILDLALNFIIPVYDNMPANNLLPTTIDTSAANSYYINGTDVQFRSEPTTSSAQKSTLAKNETVTVIELNAANNNGYTWAKVRRANGTEGYVANIYLTKCGN